MSEKRIMFENGSELIRTDFHLHTKVDKTFVYDDADDKYIKSYVDALSATRIHVGVITNHNSFDEGEYKALRKEARKKEIHLLPGVELGVKEGASAIHALFVFNPDEWLADGRNYISDILTTLFAGVDTVSSQHCEKDMNTCLEYVSKMNKDFFVVMAHVEQDKGLWKECKGAVITPMSKQPLFRKHVLAFQKVRTRDLASKVSSWMGYNIANVEGSDPKKIEEIGKGEECYLKLGSFSFSAIKYALRDYGERVFSEISQINHGYIKGVKYIGGKLDGQIFRPSPELNTLIGIRGSGKSSIIESIRYSLEIEPSTADKGYKADLVKSVLGSGGEVELEIVDKNGKHYTINRIYGETASVSDDTGGNVLVPVAAILQNPMYFGQKDLALTRQGYELELLNKIIGEKVNDISQGMSQVEDEIAEAIEKYSKVAEIPDLISDLTAKNAELNHKLKVYKEKGVDEKLKKQTACNDDLVKLKSVYQTLSDILSSFEIAFEGIDYDVVSLKGYNSEFNSEVFTKAEESISNAVSAIKKIEKSKEELKQQINNLKSTIASLEDKIASLKEEFAQIKREIKDENVDIESYIEYKKQLSENLSKIESLNEKLKQKDSLKSDIKKLFTKRNELLRRRYEDYKKEISDINQRQSQLSVDIEFKGNSALFEEALKTEFKGTRLTEQKYKEIVESFSDFSAIVEDYYYGSGERLQKICGNSYHAVAEKISNGYREYIKIETPNTINIFYHGKPLSKHSLGQRASALVLFILSQRSSDIVIIDQPEDDLDNQVIYEELIQTIKTEKPNIQFIFATHNANIPVLGDAERVVAVEINHDIEKISMEQGSIDSPETHKRIVDIMEGGEEAFKKRNEIYSSWD